MDGWTDTWTQEYICMHVLLSGNGNIANVTSRVYFEFSLIQGVLINKVEMTIFFI